MPTEAGVGYSEKTNSRDAGIQAAKAAMEQAGIQKCDLAIVFATSKHDPILLREGIRSVIGETTPLFGGGVVGVITNENLGYEGYSVGVAVLSSEIIQFDLFKESEIADREYETGLNLGRQIKSKQYEGRQNILLVYDIIKKGLLSEGSSMNMAAPLLKGMTESLGQWPQSAGGGIMGSMQWTPPFQYIDNEIIEKSAMALVLSGDVRLDTITIHGCKPSSRYYTITKVDRNTILELDGKPTLEVIAQMLGPESDKSWQDYPLFITLGVNQGDKFGEYVEDDYAVRLCMDVDRERRGLVMFGDDLTPGTDVQLMRRSIDFDYIKKRADELKQRIGDAKPFLAFYIDCAGRISSFSSAEREDAEEIQKALNNQVPLLGWYVGCEIARAGEQMQSHNWTGILCFLSEEKNVEQ
jgi:hypothetical protein